ncbi:putative P-loop ATPase [Paenibacillus sp. DS2015]|uniref:VapE domain-containing protein n=1 Tax=Paenibacillus sp. DS2015 TaxID=3373917 RepID=UPI003D1A134D
MHDIELDISFGKHRADTSWKPEYLIWDELIDRLKKVHRTSETMAEYDKMSNIARGKVKDGPAFVGGLVRGGRRKKENVDTRSMITLDVDHADDGFLFSVELVLGGTAYVVYSTHSYRPNKPKYRLIIPADRTMSPDEYAAVSRKLAEQIDIKYFDKTTFDVHRLMYLPSCSKDADPVLEVYEGDPLSVDSVLDQYADWRDVMQWPRHPEDKTGPLQSGKKPEDPRTKPGTIGLLCRAYGIEEGIELHLPDQYVSGSMPNRYTYTNGSSGNGLEVFPDQDLAYSHQDSDPVSDGRSYNLFDLIRIHKFGHLDDRASEQTNITKMPSHTAMERWAISQKEVKLLAMAEQEDEYSQMVDSDDFEYEPEVEPKDENWGEKIERHHKTGEVLCTSSNIMMILSHGVWKGILAFDAFRNAEVIKKSLPWREKDRQHVDYEPWSGADDKRLENWLGEVFKLRPSKVIQNAFTEVVHRNKFHPIKAYIESKSWDGVHRLEHLFIDYLGAEDSHYVRQVTRKMLIAAVARLYRPGCKFDEMLVLVGPQGAGKSSLLAKLGREWFSDSLRTFDNKEAGEHLQSGWIFEIGELSAMKKSEVDEVKAFLSKTEDRYRVAYDRVVSDFPRKCVFFGTTNTRDFLQDATGNRRFWPVDVEPIKAKLSHWDHLTDELVGQIWAEALHLYKAGESLALDNEAKEEALQLQTTHMEVDPREGVIREWLDAPIEDEWGEDREDDQFFNRVCASQIWVECLHKKIGDMTRWDARIICGIMRNIQGWQEVKARVRFPKWGLQTGFDRINKKNNHVL